MKVSELIERLKQYSPDHDVYVLRKYGHAEVTLNMRELTKLRDTRGNLFISASPRPVVSIE